MTEQKTTLNLLPLRDILRMDFNKENDVKTEFVSESSIIPTVTETVTNVIEHTISEDEDKKFETSVIIINNDEKLTPDMVAVYKSIINAFESKKMSKSMLYTLLQSITTIDLFSDGITIYTSKPLLLDGKVITNEELINSMKTTLKGGDLNIEIIERKDVTIAEYYIKNSF